jgi:hypothetical protein
MIAALTPKPQLVTRRLGNLAAIGNPEVQAVIWTRNLPASAFRELEESAAGLEAFSFLSLTIDPFERVQQQLRKAGLRSHFLACDMSLLVSVFGEITQAPRVRVRINDSAAGLPDLRLVAAYEARRSRELPRQAKSRSWRCRSYAAIFRGSWAQDHPLASPDSNLWFTLEAAPASQRSL